MSADESDDDRTQTHVILTKGTMVSHYRIVEKIGAGGMGEVYLAEDTKLKRKVALKFLSAQLVDDADFKARFVRETEATAKLDHPNIVTIYEVSEFQSRPFFAMQLVEGQSLSDLAKGQELAVDRIIELGIQICDGLSAAHEKKIVHRDIKPSNIVIDAYGRPKILDFGLAAIRGEEQLTRTGSIIGTVRYMSPEQVEGNNVDHRSDLFSLGVVLYDLITGRTPFEKENEAATLRAITQENPEPLARYKADIPDELQRTISKLLEKDCSIRYQTAGGVASDLKRLTTTISDNHSRRPSIAVLPFTNMSTDKEQEFFCDGIAEDILNHLAQIENLRVVSRTSSFAFKNTKEDLREVGRKLMAETVLEGSVRKAGKRLRITAQLIKASDGYHLWSEQYDRELEDVFAIQDEISSNIVQALQLKLDPQRKSNKVEAPTVNMEAYELYLRGRVFLHRSGKNGTKYALEMFSRAIEKDSGYALAYAGLANAYAQSYLYFDRVKSNLDGAMKASEKALEMGPALAEAHSARGIVVSLGRQYKEAEEEFEKAIELNPSLFEAYYHYARNCFVQQKYERACQLYERAIEVKPDDYQPYILSAALYKQLGQRDKANKSLERGMEVAKSHLLLHPNDVRAVYLGAGALAQQDKRNESLEWCERAAEMEPNDPAVLYNIACVYAILHRHDEAIDILRQAINNGFSARVWIESDPELDPIREHPEFESLLNMVSE